MEQPTSPMSIRNPSTCPKRPLQRKGTASSCSSNCATSVTGSTYRLNYNPESDLLEGIDFQAALQQEIPVSFMRLEE